MWQVLRCLIYMLIFKIKKNLYLIHGLTVNNQQLINKIEIWQIYIVEEIMQVGSIILDIGYVHSIGIMTFHPIEI